MTRFGYLLIAYGLITLTWTARELKAAYEFDQHAIEIEATIVRQEHATCTRREGTSRYPRLTEHPCYDRFTEYQVAGANYAAKITPSISPSTMGEKIRLKVDSRDPRHVSTESKFTWNEQWFNLFAVLFPIGIGAAIIYYGIRNMKLLDDLRNSAHRVRGRATHIAPTALTALTRHPRWVIKAQWVHPQTGQIHEATSLQDLWTDPRTTGQVGDDGSVDVYFDPNNPKRCAIILRDLVVPLDSIRQA
ncbi:MAG TPA: hypothetical protein PLZ57_07410 [Pseudobdellovibrionaceae bacterium]|nr:hypothetical protein [Pseudobdellovibrionaceae bacterium]